MTRFGTILAVLAALLALPLPASAGSSIVILTVQEQKIPVCQNAIAIHRLISARKAGWDAYEDAMKQMAGTRECTFLFKGEQAELVMMRGPVATITYYNGIQMRLADVEAYWFRNQIPQDRF